MADGAMQVCQSLGVPIPLLLQLARRQDADRAGQRVDGPPLLAGVYVISVRVDDVPIARADERRRAAQWQHEGCPRDDPEDQL